MIKPLFTLLMCLVASVGSCQHCAKWKAKNLEVQADSMGILVANAAKTFSRPYFKDAYAGELEAGTTSMTLEEFQVRYLPSLRHEFEKQLGKAASDNDDDLTITEHIKALPQSDEGLYRIYCKVYAFDNFLYEWTLTHLQKRNIDTRHFQLDARTAFAQSASGKLPENPGGPSAQEQLRYLNKKVTAIREMLLMEILADELEFCGGKENLKFFKVEAVKHIRSLTPPARNLR